MTRLGNHDPVAAAEPGPRRVSAFSVLTAISNGGVRTGQHGLSLAAVWPLPWRRYDRRCTARQTERVSLTESSAHHSGKHRRQFLRQAGDIVDGDLCPRPFEPTPRRGFGHWRPGPTSRDSRLGTHQTRAVPRGWQEPRLLPPSPVSLCGEDGGQSGWALPNSAGRGPAGAPAPPSPMARLRGTVTVIA